MCGDSPGDFSDAYRLRNKLAHGYDTIWPDLLYDIAEKDVASLVARARLWVGEPATPMTGRNYVGPWRKTPGRLFGVGFVRLYQLTFSGFVGGHCRHLPTCSEYAYEAIARHGLVVGGWLSAKRVARCGPFGRAGIDPVPTCRHGKRD